MASEYDVLLEEPKTAVSGTPSEYDALLEEPAAPTAGKTQPWYYPRAAAQAVQNIGQGFRNSVQDVAQAPTFAEKALRTVGGAAGNLFNIPLQAGNAFFSSIPGVNQINDQAIGGMFSRAPIPGTQGTVGDVAQGAQYVAQQHPRATSNLMAAANIAGILPVGRMVSGAADAIKGAGEVAQAEKLVRSPVGPANMTAKDVQQAASITNQAPKANILSTLNPKERNILFEPLSAHDTPFTHYAVTAKKAMNDAREPSPMDVAGSKAKAAFDELMEHKNTVGKEKGDIIRAADDYAVEQGKGIDVADVRDEWHKMLADRGGINIDEEGIIGTEPGRLNRIGDEAPMVNKINDIMKQIPDDATPLQLDDAKAAIRNITDNFKASQAVPINTITEGIGKTLRSKIDEKLSSWASENGFGKLNEVNKKYADLSDVTKQLDKRLGEITDPTTGQTRMGASLMKSAVMSNSDRGSKALFDRVKAYTGKDLVKEALYAKVAMDAVGDARATDLLHSMSETKDFVKSLAEHPTIFGAVAKVGEKGLNVMRGDRLTQMINYYNKVQGGEKPKGGFLKNRSGSIGGTESAPPISVKQQMIDETMPENAAAVRAAQEAHAKSAVAYDKAQSLLKNRPAIGGMSVLNPSEGKAIADKLGVRYNGIQPGYGKIAPYHMFTDLTPGQESSFLARNAEEAGIGLQKTRKLYGNQAGSIGGMDNPQIHTDNFKKWFSDSKVVDEKGKPLVVYHGTNKDFSVFDNEKSAQGVHWFSSDKSKIQKGKSGAASSKNVMPVYLNAKKLAGWKEYEKYSLGEIEKMGFDGIKLDDDYIVFNPSQIKSATGNSGAFNPKNPDIRGSAPMKMFGITAGISGAAGAAGMALEHKKKKSIGNMKAKGK